MHETSLERIESALVSAGSRIHRTGGDRFMAQCPAHDDRTPSLSVLYHPDTRATTLRCFAGCDPDDVFDALGMTWRARFDDFGQSGTYSDARRRHDPRFPDWTQDALTYGGAR